nr:bifunctional dihydrofolate reductase-thymidylate synthase 1-like [Tanacetum cinerariifolium]
MVKEGIIDSLKVIIKTTLVDAASYTNMHTDYTGQGFDQLLDFIDKIKNNTDDRQVLLSAWNPSDLKQMALPPCHMYAQDSYLVKCISGFLGTYNLPDSNCSTVNAPERLASAIVRAVTAHSGSDVYVVFFTNLCSCWISHRQMYLLQHERKNVKFMNQEAHAVMVNGGTIALVGLKIAALVSQRLVVSFIVLAGIHKITINLCVQLFVIDIC